MPSTIDCIVPTCSGFGACNIYSFATDTALRHLVAADADVGAGAGAADAAFTSDIVTLPGPFDIRSNISATSEIKCRILSGLTSLDNPLALPSRCSRTNSICVSVKIGTISSPLTV